ncbi:hypothetical protein P692DRAFT_20869001 [Suillus brevipes Sb2]|nr:hypothetical protein P692DRAFT_20869001 [Suillus brevipes Sb2]
MTACATCCLPPSSKHSDGPLKAAETTAKKRVRDDQIVELPAAKRACRAEDEDDEVFSLSLPNNLIQLQVPPLPDPQTLFLQILPISGSGRFYYHHLIILILCPACPLGSRKFHNLVVSDPLLCGDIISEPDIEPFTSINEAIPDTLRHPSLDHEPSSPSSTNKGKGKEVPIVEVKTLFLIFL